MPTNDLEANNVLSSILEMPKSPNLMIWSDVKNILAPLRSLCIILRSCSYLTPKQIWVNNLRIIYY